MRPGKFRTSRGRGLYSVGSRYQETANKDSEHFICAVVTIRSVYSTVNATFIPIFVFFYTTYFDHIGSSSGVLTLVLKMHYKTLIPSVFVSTCYSTSIL
jgi:hypothetical protein